MNKKQAGIIVTLLALIVCAGILAARVNGPLEVASTNTGSSSLITKDTTKNSKTDYFAESRLTRESQNATTMQTFKSIMDDKNISQADRDQAAKNLSTKTTNTDNESKIETALKGKGFDDAIAFIGDTQVKVIVKAKDLTKDQRKVIQDTVASITKIKDVDITARQ